jgi:hypothetical protein
VISTSSIKQTLDKSTFYDEPALCDAGASKIKSLLLLTLPQKFLDLSNQRFSKIHIVYSGE